MWPNFKTPTKQAPLKTLLIHLLTMCRCIKAEKGGKVGSGRWEVGSGKWEASRYRDPRTGKPEGTSDFVYRSFERRYSL